MATPIILEAHHLSVPPRIREEVSFTLREGERLCLYGQSGAGKTTLLRALLGLFRHHGEVVWYIPRHSAGYAAQRPRLIPRATVLQQILWCAQLYGVSLSVHGSRIHELLDQWGLQRHKQRAVHRLSAGEQAQLEMCCAMAVASRLLVVDGLLEQLGERERAVFWEEVDGRCARREMALLYATHSAREAELADRVLLLHEGQMLALDTPEHLRAVASPAEVRLEPIRASDGAHTLQVYLERESSSESGTQLVFRHMPTIEDVLQILAKRGRLP
jgi:ABC-2 type transport system ATP-binding protein